MYVRRLFLILCLLVYAAPAHASLMDMVSDTISTSIPGAPASHDILFTTIHAIPPGGTITITPDAGAFMIPTEFDYTDADLVVWNGTTSVERVLAPVPSDTDDGFQVETGNAGQIVITLSSSQGIPAGTKVELLLGPNATFGAQGAVSIANPLTPTSYRIGLLTADDVGASIDYATAMIAVVLPVSLTVPLKNVPPSIFGALPTGEVAAGSKIIELTFQTDRTATCRYSLTPNTPYASMTGLFTPTLSTVFYAVLSGFQDGTTYTYYIRCKGVQGAIATDDYPLTFSLAATPMSNTSVTQAGSVIGYGPVPNGSQVLYLSSATLAGFTSPGSTVQVLKDGVQLVTVQAGADGSFHADAPNVERGTYTFSLYSTDKEQHTTATYSATLTLGQGTSNTISNIVLSPTVGLETDQVPVGNKVHVSGEAVPNSGIVVSFASKTDTSAQPLQFTATTSANGVWDLMATGTLQKGTYQVRARQVLTAAQSDYSAPLYVGIGQSPSVAATNRADINKDGKVNLIDFSIMLSMWGTSNPKADLNDDGVVNLADFSILLFNWTG